MGNRFAGQFGGRSRWRTPGSRFTQSFPQSVGRSLSRSVSRSLKGDAGATTAEFAIVTMAAVGFAGLLVVILRSDGVRATLQALVERALGAAG